MNYIYIYIVLNLMEHFSYNIILKMIEVVNMK